MLFEFLWQGNFFFLVFFRIFVGHFCGVVGPVDFHSGSSNPYVRLALVFKFFHNCFVSFHDEIIVFLFLSLLLEVALRFVPGNFPDGFNLDFWSFEGSCFPINVRFECFEPGIAEKEAISS